MTGEVRAQMAALLREEQFLRRAAKDGGPAWEAWMTGLWMRLRAFAQAFEEADCRG